MHLRFSSGSIYSFAVKDSFISSTYALKCIFLVTFKAIFNTVNCKVPAIPVHFLFIATLSVLNSPKKLTGGKFN